MFWQVKWELTHEVFFFFTGKPRDNTWEHSTHDLVSIHKKTTEKEMKKDSRAKFHF